MFKHILIATDGSDVSQIAVDGGIALAKALNAKVTIATITEPIGASGIGEMELAYSANEYDKNVADWAGRVLSPAALAAKEAGIACDTVHVAGYRPAEGIINAAEEKGCDVIVMASHGRTGLQRLVLGSQAQKVVTLSKLPVLVWR